MQGLSKPLLNLARTLDASPGAPTHTTRTDVYPRKPILLPFSGNENYYTSGLIFFWTFLDMFLLQVRTNCVVIFIAIK